MSADSAAPANKKRRFVPAEPVAPYTSHAADLRVMHQTTELSLLYLRHPQSSWHCRGSTSLYVINENPGNFAMHLRGSCRVLQMKVETVSKEALVSVPVSYQHADPLAHVLVKPPQSYVEGEQPRYDADSQCSRGAVGMTLGLRAASIASHMGELRISTETTHAPVSKDDAMQFWMNDLRHPPQNGNVVVQTLMTNLHGRSTAAREARIQLVAKRLAEASDSEETQKSKAMKVTIIFEVALERMSHLGGIHSSHGPTPHVYTTTGIFGDHEGPRSWIPCLDSACSKHRASHELVVKVTAPVRDGLLTVGCGEDFGVSNTLLHDMMIPDSAAEQLGESHVHIVNDIVKNTLSQSAQHSEDGSAPHVIPLDPSSIDSVLATNVWVTQIWTPTPIRSLGFAVGPFKVLEDPEYFNEEDDDDDDDESSGKDGADQRDFVEAARKNGEGIRQAYFAPLYERKYIHIDADMMLLQNTLFELPRLGSPFLQISQDLDQTVLASTVGVPLRALSLLRDILALPTYRTTSYTQIWIPNAVHGGSTSGALHCCPEVLVNPFLGGSIMDARLLPPVGCRFPYYNGGRVLQMLQARCAVRGWITAALPLGECDDVGFGYIHALVESFLMSIYERGHGAYGEGGAKGGVFFTRRFTAGSGLNSNSLDFLPVVNIEEGELDAIVSVGAVPIEDRNSDQLWRTASNGSESHTSALDELGVRQLLYKDIVEALERGTDKDKTVPLPSMGYLGSHLSLSFLSSNATSSSELGCGAMELVHPVGGVTYRILKCELLRRVVEGRAGVANFVRLIRAAFIAAHLEDVGETELKMDDWQKKPKQKKSREAGKPEDKDQDHSHDQAPPQRPPFLLCVDELLKKHGLTHTLFIRALRILAGPIREEHLRGTLVDVERETRMKGTNRHVTPAEGFPNSYVRGASELYLRVGAHVEPVGASDGGLSTSGHATSTVAKGIHLHIVAEPVIPEGGIAFGGPITLRVVENEGQLREFVKNMKADGSRCNWGPIFLNAKPVSTARQQTAASGAIEGSGGDKPSKETDGSVAGTENGQSDAAGTKQLLSSGASDSVFTDAFLHSGGYQAIELVRLTNRTPLLWVRVDPMGIYGGRLSIVQPDACFAEQLFHDGDAGAQVDALRALAERPFRIQGSVKITTVYDVSVSELPVRILGDCLRGSPALHSSLPHTPAVRVQAAYAISQWQNNRAPMNKLAVETGSWIGLKLLLQYFSERFYDDGTIIPISFSRFVVKKNEDERGKGVSKDAGAGNTTTEEDDLYQYLDTIEDEDRRSAIQEAADIEIEEDEEYRVRCAVIQAIASIRALDGTTPATVLSFLEEVLASGDSFMVGSFASEDNDVTPRDRQKLGETNENDLDKKDLCNDDKVAALRFVPSTIIADALLSLCHVNASPALITDPTTGKTVQSNAKHPSLPLMLASHRWLEWELYRETIRSESEATTLAGVGGSTHSTVAACAITALYSLSILKQSTTDQEPPSINTAQNNTASMPQNEENVSDTASSAQFYMKLFDGEPLRGDVTRAACAQAVACICCAADRLDTESTESLGLLSALEFLLERILDSRTSPGLRQTLALLMMDACTGKVCSTQRVGAVGGRGDLCNSAARLLTGPLGASYGGDNGSALLMTVNEISYPAANAVNDGARAGLRLLSRAGHPRDTSTNQVIARVAKFATSLWRTINGDNAPPPSAKTSSLLLKERNGVCAYDGHLRCSLLSLWQWIWPKGCFAVLRVQAWKSLEGTQQYKTLGADLVMKITDAESEAASAEEASLAEINNIVEKELDRQRWRGEMAAKAYDYYKLDSNRGIPDVTGTAEQGIPLPPIQRDSGFKQGGWVASAAQQRRAQALDGGIAVTKIRLTVTKSSSVIE